MRIVEVTSTDDLNPAAILAIAHGARIELQPALLATVSARRTEVLRALADGRPVYGVNTGMGAQSDVRLDPAEQSRHQNNLLLARAVGGPPWLSRLQVRALYAVRLRTFLTGDAGVSPELMELLAAFLNADLMPAVPRTGYGNAGEIIPLAHAFGPLTGIGAVLAGDTTAAAATALRDAGLAPITLGPKEGIALLQGIPGATALALLIVERARKQLDQWMTALALSTAAIGAPRDLYDAALARGDAALQTVNTAMRQRIAGTVDNRRVLQAPVSFRVASAALAHLLRSIEAVEQAIDRALNGVTDSPAFVDGQFHGTAGFHGIDLAAHLDGLTVAIVHIAEGGLTRTHRLLDSRFTGLPAQLAPRPGPDTGLITVHKRSAGVVHRMRRAAMSTVVGSIETSFGQEDMQTFSWEAAINTADTLADAADVLAGELLVATQAISLGETGLGPALHNAQDAVRAVVPPIERDRIFGPDLEAIRELLENGDL